MLLNIHQSPSNEGEFALHVVSYSDPFINDSSLEILIWFLIFKANSHKLSLILIIEAKNNELHLFCIQKYFHAPVIPRTCVAFIEECEWSYLSTKAALFVYS